MKSFEALNRVLAERQKPAKVFFRDDDGGWADDRLQKLARDFIDQELPLDVAVIPDALSKESIDCISALLESNCIAIHQHGYTHENHQLSGRSCEFGSDRNYQQQYQDILAGKNKLTAYFGAQVIPVFTPPWNRCTDDTVAVLQSLNLQYLSRIVGSHPIGRAVPELPVAVDWLKKSKGVRLNNDQLSDYIVSLFKTDEEVIGIMLHHEHMDRDNRLLLRQFIETLRSSGLVSFHPMMELASGYAG